MAPNDTVERVRIVHTPKAQLVFGYGQHGQSGPKHWRLIQTTPARLPEATHQPPNYTNGRLPIAPLVRRG